MPLYLLTLLNLASVSAFETDNLSDRIATTATFFLAAFAMLYVVGSALPKTDFLTRIDLVILLTTCSLAAIGLGSCVIAWLHAHLGPATATEVNLGLEIATLVVNLFGNLALLLPPRQKQRAAIAASRTAEVIEGDEPGAVRSVFSYVPFDQVPSADGGPMGPAPDQGRGMYLHRRQADANARSMQQQRSAGLGLL